jgi:hypothetical protein
MASHLPLNTAPRDGTLIRFWCRSEAEPIIWLLVPRLHRLGVLHGRRAADPPRRDRLGADRRPGYGEGRTAREAQASHCHHRGGWRGESSVPSDPLADACCEPLMAENRPDAHELPTPRSISRTGYRVHVWCKACQHAKDADLAALIADCRGDVPLVQMKWRCGNCGS